MIRQKVDYGKYRYSQKEILKYIGESAALCGAVDYLFYQTPWVMLRSEEHTSELQSP